MLNLFMKFNLVWLFLLSILLMDCSSSKSAQSFVRRDTVNAAGVWHNGDSSFMVRVYSMEGRKPVGGFRGVEVFSKKDYIHPGDSMSLRFSYMDAEAYAFYAPGVPYRGVVTDFLAPCIDTTNIDNMTFHVDLNAEGYLIAVFFNDCDGKGHYLYRNKSVEINADTLELAR